MSKVMRELIEYDGITICPYENMPYFTQLNVEHIFSMPPQKPDVDRIVSVYAEGTITDSKVISTVKGKSLEGQNLEGHDVMVSGEIFMKIEYLECESCNNYGCNIPINTAETSFSFYGDIVLPQQINIDSIINVSIGIEDIFSEKMDLRSIYNNITMMLVADVSYLGKDLNIKTDNCSKNLLPIMPTYFTQEMICEMINIDPKKLDIERILDISVWPEIESMKLINTVRGTSNEGQILSGVSLVVEVKVKEKITYIACEPTQMVQVDYHENLKIINIVVPSEVNGRNIYDLVRSGRISVTPYVEGVKFTKMNSKSINLCMMLLVDVKVC
jgi:hypothetical protein